MATALAAPRGRATRRGYTATYRATRPGRARLDVLGRRGRVVASVERAARAGLSSLRVRRRLPFGSYGIRLTLTGADGQRARDTVGLFLGGRLPVRAARSLAVPDEVDVGDPGSTGYVDMRPVRVETCRRADPRQVICRYSYRDGAGRTAVIVSARLTRIGTLVTRRYECKTPSRCPARPPVRLTEPVLASPKPGA
jgi:hypothetical protein